MATKQSVQISQEDSLAYSHMQDLATIQAEIHALREAIPIFLTPLLHRPAEDENSPGAAEKAEDFRMKASKIQGDVKQLVTNLERMCGTLEAAEKVRNEDYDDQGQLKPNESTSSTVPGANKLKAAQLERVGVAKEYGTDHESNNLTTTTTTADGKQRRQQRVPSIHIDATSLPAAGDGSGETTGQSGHTDSLVPPPSLPMTGTGSSAPRSPRRAAGHSVGPSIASVNGIASPSNTSTAANGGPGTTNKPGGSSAMVEQVELGNGMSGFDSNDIAYDDFGIGGYADMDWASIGMNGTEQDTGLGLGLSPTA